MAARIPIRQTITAAVAATTATLLLAACGDQTGTSQSGGTDGGRSDAPLFAKLPKKYQDAGVIRVGTDAAYAPMEFMENGRIVGVDPDIADALGKQLGVKFVFTSGTFDSLITSLTSGRQDVVMSSMSDTKARQEGLDDKGQKTGNGVDFVDYFTAGSVVYVQKGNPQNIRSIADLCGRKAAVQRGTTFENVVKTQSKKCEAEGRPAVAIEAFPTDAEAQTRVKAGGAVAGVNDFPVALHLARTAGGGKTFEIVGEQIEAGPFGIAVDKKDTQLRDALAEALDVIINDGSYKKALDKWGAGSGAVTSAEVNSGS
ncbi:ABC transporter substrate-binding protein [Streptomyces sp. Je 1-79]|uniref:ABC transporter substrate-binding protein n=1 Tax=Streptomyces sp. Je 1-79 TaxID=2943847 RepID=UPI0021A939BA|nr:ABC transporter substrate-binding protein [Streptomyces sp. Je 1-79]MCT4357846.1 ABC transporter substrate-binding protein [Streptomyces sp. Je 1-79]